MTDRDDLATARALGVHVSRHADPRTVPVRTPHGPVWLRCDTTHTYADPTGEVAS